MYDKELIFSRYPQLTQCRQEMETALILLSACVRSGNKLLLCGNGGSAADCEHIAGELIKGFLKKRSLSSAEKEAWTADLWVAEKLQNGICAISLPGISATISAICNDTDPRLAYAQLVWAMGAPRDILLAISTSGNAENVKYAAKTAKQKGLQVVALTGHKESPLSQLADVTIRVPEQQTYMVQELHLPVYHWLCAALEDALFGE